MGPEEIRKMAEMEDKHFWFTATRNIIKKILLKEKLNSKSLVLDIGCGTGGTIRALGGKEYIIGADYESVAAEFCKNSGIKKVLRADALNQPFRDETFDFVLALDILEHIKNDIEVLREINRILKCNGKLFLTVPAFPFLYSTHDKALGHQRRYTKKEIKGKLLKTGFLIKKCSFYNMFLFPPIAVIRVLKKKKLTQDNVQSDLLLPPLPLNIFLHKIISFEGELIKFLNLPIGLTLFLIGIKRS